MNGIEIKKILQTKGFTLSDIALKLNKSPQAFNEALKAADIKTGLLESIATAIGQDMSFFYSSIGSKNNSALVNGNGNSVVSGENNRLEVSKCQDDLEIALREVKHLKEVIEGKDKLLEEKERLINVLMNK